MNLSRNHFGWKRGIRAGSLKDGTDTTLITSAAEGIAVDSKGVIYGAVVVTNDLKEYVKE